MRRALFAFALLLVPLAALPADASDAACDAVPLVAPPGWGAGAPETHRCVGKIRPGALMTEPYGCTMSWIVEDDLGALYVATAGHCVATGDPRQRVSVEGVGPVGHVAYMVNAGVGRDFALVRIDADVLHLVDPTLCHWGGPTEQPEFNPVHGHRWLGPNPQGALLHYGWGFLTNVHGATRAREAYAAGLDGAALLNVGNFNPGDSGSPVMFATGAPAGVVTHSFLVPPGVGAGLGFATRADAALEMASAATGRSYSYVLSDVPVGMGLLEE